MLEEHWDYVRDSIRTKRFEAAIGKSMVPNARVLDLGCGVGIFGALCLRAGAAEVVAIDRSAIIDLAYETFVRAGHIKKIQTIRGVARRIAASEPFDLIVCDHVGYFGFDYGIVELLVDARERFLKPNGRLIPQKIELQLSLVESTKCRSRVDGWASEGVPEELHWLRSYGTNMKHAVNLSSGELLSAPTTLGYIDFRAEKNAFFSWKVPLTVERAGELHGLGGWFDCTLADKVTMTNSPVAPDRINRPQAFLPIERPIAVMPGDIVEVTVAARPRDDLLAWTVDHRASRSHFRHFTWESTVLGASDFLRTKPEHVPRVTAEAKARATVLRYCDGLRTVHDVEKAVLREHPDLFPTSEAISRFVSDVIAQDTQ